MPRLLASVPLRLFSVALLCAAAVVPSAFATSSKIVSPAAGAVITATPFKVTIAAQSDVSFAVALNGRPIQRLFTKVENNAASALLRRRNLRSGLNTLTVIYANHETASVQFTYAPPTEILPGSSPGSSPNYFAIQSRIVNGSGSSPSDYVTQVGDNYYAAPAGGSLVGFHVVALDRSDGSLKFNIVVPGDAVEDYNYIAVQIHSAASENCTGSWGCTLIISSMQSIGPTPCYAIPKAQCTLYDPGYSMSSLGGTARVNFEDGSRPTNAYSMITTIGQNGETPGVGQGYERVACASGSGCLIMDGAPNVYTGNGNISGALVPDNLNALTFAPISRPTFSLRPTHNPSEANTITVNGNSYTQSLSGNQPGVHVLIVDASNLSKTFDYAFPLANLQPMVQGINAYLYSAGATQNILIFVATMGSFDPTISPASWLQFAQTLTSFGATYHLVTGLKAGDDYAMVGAPDTDQIDGVGTPPASEVSSVVTRYASSLNPLPRTQMLGYLKRDHSGYYRPRASNLGYNFSQVHFAQAAQNIGVALLDQTALQLPVSWPFCPAGNCASVNPQTNGQYNLYQAMSYYVSVACTGNPQTCTSGTPNIREDYPQDEGIWDTYSSNIAALTSLTLNQFLQAHEANQPWLQSYSTTDFTLVKNQLQNEMVWVAAVHTYADNVANSVNNNKTNLVQQIGNIYDELGKELQTNPSQPSPVYADVMGAISGILSIASYSTIEDGAYLNLGLDASSVLISWAMSATNQQSGAPVIVNDQLQTTLADLRVDTANAFTSSLDSMANMFALIFADANRLQTLGVALGNNPTPVLQWGLDTSDRYVQQGAISMSRAFTADFFGVLYNVYTWNDLTSGGPPYKNYLAICNAEGVSSGDCNLGQHFDGSDWLNMRDKPNGQSPNSNNDGNFWNVLLIASKDASFHGHSTGCFEGTCVCDQEVHGAYPFDSVMQQIFAPIGTYPNQAINIGAYPPWFFTRYGIPQTPFFAHTGCTSGD